MGLEAVGRLRSRNYSTCVQPVGESSSTQWRKQMHAHLPSCCMIHRAGETTRRQASKRRRGKPCKGTCTCETFFYLYAEIFINYASLLDEV